jgi:hypothetical protein
VKNLIPTTSAGNAGEMWLQSRKIPSLSNPNEVVLFSETYLVFGTTQNNNWNVHRNLRDLDPQGAGNYDHVSVIHNAAEVNRVGCTGIANFVAADGHAEGMMFTQQTVNRRWPGTRIYP